MKNNCVFTICAKNYLAQAIALKKSLKETEPDLDFFIFLSDTVSGLDNEDVVSLNESWIPNWKQMAFKYNVIEFSTSIKPFCINLLFKKYDNVVYLDPDIYVLKSLNYIFETLQHHDLMISPHCCEIEEQYTGAVSEEELLFVGIYNLGFLAIKKSAIGQKVINWWMNRLATKCYADKIEALHVDQKWFDFIPAFYPQQTAITHHSGINTAIWNLHERELIVKNGEYLVRNKVTGEIFPLIFFHFSGFNPNKPNVINRRHPNYNIEVFPSFAALFKEYTDLVLASDFSKYTKMPYGFNVYSNHEKITPLQRRLFRQLEFRINDADPFNTANPTYSIFRESKFLTKEIVVDSSVSDPNIRNSKEREINKGKYFLKFLKMMLGIRYYNYFLSFFTEFHRLDKQVYLIDDKIIEKYADK